VRQNYKSTLVFVSSFFAVVFIVVALTFGPLIWKVLSERVGVQKFDAGRWRASLVSETSDPIRQRMVDDLLARGQLLGKRCEEVRQSLGTPPPTDYFREYDLVYWLGPERGWFSIDSEWLVIKCSANGGVVTEARLVTD
jgi:hypothetical protein